MPTYEYGCPNSPDHDFEHFCSMSDKPATLPCPTCGAEAKSIVKTAPTVWGGVGVLDYPGSKKFKAGYVHSHGDKPAEKVSMGFGGMINPSTTALHPLANRVVPDPPKKNQT